MKTLVTLPNNLDKNFIKNYKDLFVFSETKDIQLGSGGGISNILKIPDEEILKNMNNPDKCSLEQIRKTKHVIRNDLEAAKNLRADTFIYT